MLDAEHYHQDTCQMDDMRFRDIMQRERERLNHERDEILNHLKELESKLAEINRELAPIDAYVYRRAMMGAPTRNHRSFSTHII